MIVRRGEAELLLPLCKRLEQALNELVLPGGFSALVFTPVLLIEGNGHPLHGEKTHAASRGGQKWIMLQRHLDYPRFMDATPQERLALMARTFLDGILELPKARGLKQLDAKALHETLHQTLEAEGLLATIENI